MRAVTRGGRTKKLKVGDIVEVLSKEEILRTLDAKGELDGMPFMPEMLEFCGKRYRVYKRAHKTCDYSIEHPWRLRRLKDCVHLETRCSGKAHDDCDAGCLLYWKDAWLEPVDADTFCIDVKVGDLTMASASKREGCEEAALKANTRFVDSSAATVFKCQTTQIPASTSPLPWWNLQQYAEDYRSGNVSLKRLIDALTYSIFFHLSQSGIGLGRPMRWLYNATHNLWGGTRFPPTQGLIPIGGTTPSMPLGLRPGELVRVKEHEEILKTVTVDHKNKGMYWGAELVPYCGKIFRVRACVYRLIDERTSKMVEMKSPCVILEAVVCQGRYSQCRMLCPKSMYPYWREIWLERVDHETKSTKEQVSVS
jgi:hypothetical protein